MLIDGYKAAVFDFDYTLGDATDGIVMCVNHALDKMDMSGCSREAIRNTIGLTLPETFMRLTGIDDTASGRKFAALFREKADVVMTVNTRLYSDTLQVLQFLKDSGVSSGIVTTKYHYRIDEILDKFGIRHLIDIVVGSEDVQKAKPEPEGLLYAVRALSMDAGDVIYVGDSVVDAQTAENARIDFIAVTTGATPAHMFRRYPYRAIIPLLSGLIG